VKASYAIELVETAPAYCALGVLFREYQAHINVDLCFQGFEAELASIEAIYAAPDGAAFIAAGQNAQRFGCIALKRLAPDVCEMKRLYVRPRHQGAGVGRALAQACIGRARALSYARMRLDTLATMHAAQRLYRSLGFVEIGAYYVNPHPDACFMECQL
jgi:putative acetyltransferase